jgi:iron complex transport system permease protein
MVEPDQARASPAIPQRMLALVVLLLALVLISLMVGAVSLPLSQMLSGLKGGDSLAALILYDIRLPRTLLALLVGGILGLSGASLQGLMRNPLADPTVFGAPQAAAFGAVLVLYSGVADALSVAVPLAAIAAALGSIGLLMRLAGRNAAVVALILAGLALGALAGALTSIVIALSANPFAVTEIVFWMMGSFEDRSMWHVALAAPFILIAMLMLLSQGTAYRALVLGEDSAASLGINCVAVRWITLAAVAMGVGGAVAVAGAIGFVGLIAPFVARMLVGSDPKRILWPSLLIGSALMLMADCLVRIIPAQTEMRIGALTALLGVPLFVAAIRRQRGLFGQG